MTCKIPCTVFTARLSEIIFTSHPSLQIFVHNNRTTFQTSLAITLRQSIIASVMWYAGVLYVTGYGGKHVHCPAVMVGGRGGHMGPCIII